MSDTQCGEEFIYKHVSASWPESEIQGDGTHSAHGTSQPHIDRDDPILNVHSARALSELCD